MIPSSESSYPYRVVLLAGGVGAARLAIGLTQLLTPEQLTIVVNTGDDFRHCGLYICPDLDTIMYSLAGLNNRAAGWGLANESWQTMAAVRRLAGPTWFNLGDHDLATHLVRSQLLQVGQKLTAVTHHLRQQLGVHYPLLPMADAPAPTFIETNVGRLPFQEWFVRERWQPVVKRIDLPDDIRATRPVVLALEQADIVLIAPSNPFVSIDPILNVYPVRALLQDMPRAVVAVSPIIGGQAVKGPAAKMMVELRLPVSAAGIAQYYGEWLDGLVYDSQDQPLVADALANSDLASTTTDILMPDADASRRVAAAALDLAGQIIAGAHKSYGDN